MKRSFSKQNMNNFYSKLQETDFSAVLNIDCPNLAYNKFMELYLVEFDTSFPLRETSSRSKFIRREPWFTPGLLTSSINKEKILSMKLRKPTVENISKYKVYNSIFNKLKRKMKKILLQNISGRK